MHDLPVPPPGLFDGAALFLDFDGTLVELAETPGSIRVAPELPGLLRRLCASLGGRIAIVSGRSIGDLEHHLDCSGIAVSGSHGLELRLADGTHLPLFTPRPLEDVRAALAALAEAIPGLILEEKPAGLALHYRQAPEAEERVLSVTRRLAVEHGLTLQQGKMVAELRPAGADKGDALRALMAEPPFAGARPVVVGDDLTDEHAFEAAAAMGGAGVLVGEARETAASYRLPTVAAVAEWLARAG